MSISIFSINNQLQVLVTDNGLGTDIDQLKNPGIGLQNIRERVGLLDGFVKFLSEPGQGLEINIKIPLKNVLQV